MGRAGVAVYRTARYRAERELVLAGQPLCVHCGRRPGTEADHQPPLSCHHHVAGTGCCILVPSCFRCGRRQGAALVNGHRPRRRRSTAFAKMPGVTAAAETVATETPAGFDVADPIWEVAWLDELREVPADAVWPRLMTAPHPAAVGSYGADVVAHAADTSAVTLRWWQRLWMARLLEHDDTGALCWGEAVVTVARQVGKSWGLRELAMWRMHQRDLFGEAQDVVHTGKDVGICREVQRPAWAWARQRRDDYKLRLVNGQEQVERLADGSRWMLRAKDSVYGLSASLALVDEAWDVPVNAVDDGLVPTMVARHSAQLLLISTAHRRATPLVIGRRQAALDDLATADVLLLEWSAPADADIDDLGAWRLASPSWDRTRERLLTTSLAKARAGEVVDPDEPDPLAGFSTQWLNIWPEKAARTGSGEPLVSPEVWAGCEGSLDVDGPGWIALEQNPGGQRGAAVAFVAVDGDRFEVDGRAVESWADALRLAQRFRTLRPGSRLIVGANLAATVNRDWPGVGEFRKAGATETPRALPLFRSLVDAGCIVHDQTADLDHQIGNARVKPTANGTLTFVGYHRGDLVRAAIWAIQAAYTPPPAPQVHA